MILGAAILAGCGNQIPDMTQDKSNEIAQYAADLLISSKTGNTKLIDVKAETARRAAIAKQKADLAAKVDAWEKAQQDIQSGSQSKPAANSGKNTQTASGSAAASEGTTASGSDAANSGAEAGTGAQNGSGNTAGSSSVAATSAQAGDIASFFNMNGLTISYDGYELTSTYTDKIAGNQDGGPSIKATDGVQFLVLKLKVSNQTSADIASDIISQKASFQIIADGNQGGSSLMTLMPSDFSLLKDNISANSTQDYVLITQVSSDLTTVSKLNLTIQKDQKAISIDLQ